jgi:hypothetical protein
MYVYIYIYIYIYIYSYIYIYIYIYIYKYVDIYCCRLMDKRTLDPGVLSWRRCALLQKRFKTVGWKHVWKNGKSRDISSVDGGSRASTAVRLCTLDAGVVSFERFALQLALGSGVRKWARGCDWQPLPVCNERPSGTNRSRGQRQGCCNACVQHQRSAGVPAPVQAGTGHARLVWQGRGYDQQVRAARALRCWQVNVGIYIIWMYIHILEYYLYIHILAPGALWHEAL